MKNTHILRPGSGRAGFTTPLVIAIMAFAVVSFLFLIDTAINPDGTRKTTTKNTNQAACTLEAKLCPDGSAVGRTGPNCEFGECPATNTNAAYQNTNTAPDPTAGWKTYTNTSLGFSIKHPSDWKIDNTMTPNKVWFNLSQTEIVDSIEVATTSRTLDNIYNEAVVTNGTKIQTTLGGQPAVRLDLAEFGLVEIYSIYNQKLFIVRTNNELKKDPTILSTFTFISPTARWKTYEDSKYSFNVHYPPSWSYKLYTTGYNNEGSYVVAFFPINPPGPLPFISVKENWSVRQEIDRINSLGGSTRVTNQREGAINGVQGTEVVYTTDIGSTPASFIAMDGSTAIIFNAFPNQTDWETVIGSFASTN